VFDGTGVLADVILSMLASHLPGCLVKVDNTLEYDKRLTTMAIVNGIHTQELMRMLEIIERPSP
jgi:hypothetical protein